MANLHTKTAARPLEELETSVLFDVASQAATNLGGMYVWLEDHAVDETSAVQWRKAGLDVGARRRSLNPDDRGTVIAAVREWGSERRRLEALYPLQ